MLRRRAVRGPLVAAVAAAALVLGGCAGVRPPESEVRRGIASIMTDQGLSEAGAQRVADCLTPKIYPTAGTVTLQRLASGEHAVLPEDERGVSRAEAECVAATG
ncbi:hypothetical protein [Naumannella huperziae]